jgi:hypothetical protein
MFNLEQAIAEWRREMIAAGIKTPVPLEELESHLREDVEQQRRTGVDTEEAFRLAAERIGKAENVREEFGKIEDAKRTRNRERLRRWSVIAGTGFVFTMMSITWYFGARSGKMEITWVEVVLALGAMAAILAFDWVGRSVSKYLPVIHDGWILAIALGALFSERYCSGFLFLRYRPRMLCTCRLWCSGLFHRRLVLEPAFRFGTSGARESDGNHNRYV